MQDGDGVDGDAAMDQLFDELEEKGILLRKSHFCRVHLVDEDTRWPSYYGVLTAKVVLDFLAELADSEPGRTALEEAIGGLDEVLEFMRPDESMFEYFERLRLELAFEQQ